MKNLCTLGAVLCLTIAAAGCGDDTTSAGAGDMSVSADMAICTGGGPVAGAQDMHCYDDGGAQFVAVDPAMCTIDAGDSSGGGGDFGDTMYNSSGNDDDCKYAVSFTIPTGVCDMGNTSFLVTLKDALSNQGIAGASNVRPEVFKNDASNTPVNTSTSTTTDMGGGVYNDRAHQVPVVGKLHGPLPLLRELHRYADVAARPRGVLHQRSVTLSLVVNAPGAGVQGPLRAVAGRALLAEIGDHGAHTRDVERRSDELRGLGSRHSQRSAEEHFAPGYGDLDPEALASRQPLRDFPSHQRIERPRVEHIVGGRRVPSDLDRRSAAAHAVSRDAKDRGGPAHRLQRALEVTKGVLGLVNAPRDP